MRVPIHLRLPPELLAAVDARAEGLGWTRTQLTERALEAALGLREGVTQVPSGSAPSRPASPRVSDTAGVARARQARLNKAKGM